MRRVFVAAGLVVAFTALGFDCTTATEAEYRALGDEILAIAATNRTAATALANTAFVWGAYSRPDLAAFRSEYDSRFAEVLTRTPLWALPKWPACSEAEAVRHGVATNAPLLYRKAHELNCVMTPGEVARAAGDITTAVQLLSEAISSPKYPYGYSMSPYDELRAFIQKAGERSVRRYLRSNGKSFVVKDGVNPCAVYMERLNAALNAPRFSGLNTWLVEMGVSASVDTSKLPSDAELHALQEAILYGEKDLTPYYRVQLCLCLGVDGFNAFVREYNGDNN